MVLWVNSPFPPFIVALPRIQSKEIEEVPDGNLLDHEQFQEISKSEIC